MWTVLLVGNIGTWMRDVGSGWLMTSLSASALAVALVQVATTMPIFLLSLPSGALADIVDRRQMMIVLCVVGGAILTAIAVLTQTKAITAELLVILLFAAGTVTAMMTPVLQSLTPLMVNRDHLKEAIALNSMGLNVARAIGPAVGGFLIVWAGVAWTFWFDALTYFVLLAAFIWWRGASSRASEGLSERLAPAMRTGLRYALNSPSLKRVLSRAALFYVFASSYWALLPLIARNHLGGDATYYGIILGCVGVGAVAGALFLPRLRQHRSSDFVMQGGLAITISVLVVLALLPHRVISAFALGLAGFAWIAVVTTANVSTQTQLPNWVRGRGLAVYLTVFYGSMTAGSVVWGAIADTTGITQTLLIAASVGVISGLISMRLPLPVGEPDLRPSMHWPEPSADLLHTSLGERTPVMVTIKYEIAKEASDEFIQLMRKLSIARKRDGAYNWGLFESLEHPRHWIEVFFLPDWDEHMRQHKRVTHEDALLQEQIRSLNKAEQKPIVNHFLSV